MPHGGQGPEQGGPQVASADTDPVEQSPRLQQAHRIGRREGCHNPEEVRLRPLQLLCDNRFEQSDDLPVELIQAGCQKIVRPRSIARDEGYSHYAYSLILVKKLKN